MKRAKKLLSRKQYLKQFSRSARWRLPPQESAEAIADYREMVYQPERDESKLVEELGDPVQAAWLLTDAREFKRWRRVFAALLCCALFLAGWAYDGLPFYWRLIPWHYPRWWVEFVQILAPLAVGMPLALLWFRRENGQSGPAPKGLWLALALAVLAGGGVLVQVWRCFDMKWDITYFGDGFGSQSYEFAAVLELVIDVGVLAPAAAVAGLFLARWYDRRWAALLILGLTVSALSVIAQTALLGINPQAGLPGMAAARRELFGWLVPIGAVGLIGTGAALK